MELPARIRRMSRRRQKKACVRYLCKMLEVELFKLLHAAPIPYPDGFTHIEKVVCDKLQQFLMPIPYVSFTVEVEDAINYIQRARPVADGDR